MDFKADGYLEKAYLDREGGKHVTFEFSTKDAVELAKLELMGRDLNNHRPVLLSLTVRQAGSEENDEENSEKDRQAGDIQDSGGATGKNKRLF